MKLETVNWRLVMVFAFRRVAPKPKPKPKPNHWISKVRQKFAIPKRCISTAPVSFWLSIHVILIGTIVSPNEIRHVRLLIILLFVRQRKKEKKTFLFDDETKVLGCHSTRKYFHGNLSIRSSLALSVGHFGCACFSIVSPWNCSLAGHTTSSPVLESDHFRMCALRPVPYRYDSANVQSIAWIRPSDQWARTQPNTAVKTTIKRLRLG